MYKVIYYGSSFSHYISGSIFIDELSYSKILENAPARWSYVIIYCDGNEFRTRDKIDVEIRAREEKESLLTQ